MRTVDTPETLEDLAVHYRGSMDNIALGKRLYGRSSAVVIPMGIRYGLWAYVLVDFVHDVVTEALLGIDEYDSRFHFSTFLWLKARKRINRYWGMMARLNGQVELDGQVKFDRPAPEQDLEAFKNIARDEGVKTVIQLLRRLSPRERDVVELRAFHDCDTDETARLLKTSPGNVKVRYSQAIAKLRSYIRA